MKHKKLFLAGGLLLLSLALILYPLISNWYNERHSAEIHTSYEAQLEQTDNAILEEARQQAIRYNESITPGIQYTGDGLESAVADYGSLLDVTGSGIMGYVIVPRIGVTLPIYHGTDADTLEIGVGHLLGSSLPVGGDSTHSILTAHSGMATQTMFSDLDRVEKDDWFYVDVLGEVMAYVVTDIYTVLPHDTEYLSIEEGRDLCTLVTCTPFGVNTHRLLVRGERMVINEPEFLEDVVAEIAEESTWMDKYIDGLATGIVIVLVLAVLTFFVWVYTRRN